MIEKIFPRLQLVLALLFAATAIYGPMLTAEAKALLIYLMVVGLLLGVVTLRLGWRMVMEKLPVEYPFAGWAAAVLKPFITSRQRKRLTATRLAPPVLGIGSLVVGGLILVGVGIAAIVVLL